jgi:hypothetical protein
MSYYPIHNHIFRLTTDEHRGVEGVRGIKGDTPSKFFTKLVIKNAINNKKLYPPPHSFHTHYIPLPKKIGKNLMDPPAIFSNCVHLQTLTFIILYDFVF